MKKIFRLSAIILLAAFVLTAMTACLGTSDEEFIKKALSASAELKNFEAEMNMDIGMSFDGSSMSTSMKMDMVCFDDPLKMKMNMNMSYFGMNMNTEMYIADNGGGKATLYTKMDDIWYSEEVNIDEFLSNQNVNISGDLELYLKNAGSFKKDGEEKIKDYDTVKFTGVITGQDLKEVISATGVADMATQFEYSDSMLDEMINNIGDLKISIWIDKNTYNPIKYTMDMTEMMQKIIEAANTEGAIDKCVIDMTIFNCNKATDFEIPAEALNAVEA